LSINISYNYEDAGPMTVKQLATIQCTDWTCHLNKPFNYVFATNIWPHLACKQELRLRLNVTQLRVRDASL